MANIFSPTYWKARAVKAELKRIKEKLMEEQKQSPPPPTQQVSPQVQAFAVVALIGIVDYAIDHAEDLISGAANPRAFGIHALVAGCVAGALWLKARYAPPPPDRRQPAEDQAAKQ